MFPLATLELFEVTPYFLWSQEIPNSTIRSYITKSQISLIPFLSILRKTWWQCDLSMHYILFEFLARI